MSSSSSTDKKRSASTPRKSSSKKESSSSSSRRDSVSPSSSRRKDKDSKSPHSSSSRKAVKSEQLSSTRAEEICRHAEDPDRFHRLCLTFKNQKKADRNEFLTNVTYDSSFMPLYRSEKLLNPQLLAKSPKGSTAYLPSKFVDVASSLSQSSFPKTLVVDLGTSSMRVGWAGDFNPTLVFPTTVGQSNWSPTPVGYDTLPYSKCMPTINPIGNQNKIKIEEWENIERLFSYSIEKLGVVAEETSILLSVPTVIPSTGDSRTILKEFSSMIFDKFCFNSASFCSKESLALYGSGYTTGVIVHIGDNTSRVVPVYEGSALLDIGQINTTTGSTLTEDLAEMISKKSPLTGYIEENLVRDIKENLCFVASDSKKASDELAGRNTKYTTPHYLPASATAAMDYTLEKECWKCPEKLFKNTETERGIQNTLYDAVYFATQADSDLLGTYFKNIVLSGGSTKFAGFEKRLASEVTKLIPSEMNIKASVQGHSARQSVAWRGGSIRACLEHGNAVSLERYNELGPYRTIWSQLF